jgi:hypothetical protein
MATTTVIAAKSVTNAQELLQVLTELVSIPKTLGEPVGAPQIYILDDNSIQFLYLRLEEEKLTDGSKVYNIRIG